MYLALYDKCFPPFLASVNRISHCASLLSVVSSLVMQCSFVPFILSELIIDQTVTFLYTVATLTTDNRGVATKACV